jgi:sulfite reductase alpha subunit-like flavoprotein
VAKVSIVVGSVYGAAIYVGNELEEKLTEGGHEVVLSDKAGLDAVTAEGLTHLVVCTSSTGAGDLPHNIAPFFTALVNDWPRIDHLKFVVVGLGDSSYPNYNGAALTLDHQLEDMGAQRLSDALLFDACETVTPEDEAVPQVAALIRD